MAREKSNVDICEFLLQHYREKTFESEGRRSLLTILKQSISWQSFDAYEREVPQQIGTVRTDELLFIFGYFVEQDPDCIPERNHNGDFPLHIACRERAHFPVQ